MMTVAGIVLRSSEFWLEINLATDHLRLHCETCVSKRKVREEEKRREILHVLNMLGLAIFVGFAFEFLSKSTSKLCLCGFGEVSVFVMTS